MFGFSTYWNTLRYLRPIQLFGRLWFRVPRARPRHRPTPMLRVPRDGVWAQPARRAASVIGVDCVRLLNESADLSTEGWDNPDRAKLWRYNLHYFDDLNAMHAEVRRAWQHALMQRWVRENPPTHGTGWESYPTSLRIVNWIKWALAGNQLESVLVENLAIQTRWLRKRIEIHLLGNHLFSNAKALIFAGLFFDGVEAEGWLDAGMRILDREVPEQILPDGGQFELSTMYQSLALEDMLDLWNVARTFAAAIPIRWKATVDTWPNIIRAMRNWLSAMCHPDGEISYFNDATGRYAPCPEELERYASQLSLDAGPSPPVRTVWLEYSGYIRVQAGPAVAILDVARIGPDYLPAHAHADTLSFELSVFGQRVLVNTGTSCYGHGAERLRQRGTAAHNTVVVNGKNSSEVWAGFRVASRARPLGLHVVDGSEVTINCSHDGYRRLDRDLQHQRRWRISNEEMVIDDYVSGRFRTAEAYFHFHPSVLLDIATNPGAGERYVLRLGTGERVRCDVDGGIVRWEATIWCSAFGVEEPGLCLVAEFSSPRLRTRVRWGGPV